MRASCTTREGEAACFDIQNRWRVALYVEPFGGRNSASLSHTRNLRRMSIAERIDGRDMGRYYTIEQDIETLRPAWKSHHKNLT